MGGPVRELARRAARRSYRLTKYRIIRRLERQRGTPIVIFAMSKTATTAIYHALLSRVPNPVLKTHMVLPESLKVAEHYYRKTDLDARPRHLFDGFYLSSHLPTPRDPWTIITVVRDPIARAVSDFFQSAERMARSRDPAVMRGELERYARLTEIPRALNWFETEFEPVTGIDVYACPFDHSRGYQIIEAPNARVLVLRYESMQIAPAALREFLGLSDALEMATENVGSTKGYGDLYAAVLSDSPLSSQTFDEAYRSRLVRHFYRPHEVEAFRRQWESSRDRAANPGDGH